MSSAGDDAEVLRGILGADAERVLLQHRSRFLAALERRARSREVAEEVLQAAYVRVLERGAPAVGEEGVVAWFSAVLRNAWLDRLRRARVEADAALRLSSAPEEEEVEAALHQAVCACVHDAIEGLRPGYAELLRQVELGGRPLGEVAREAGITSNNAGVRLHRARQALGRQLGRLCGACAAHGCLECSCRGA